MDGEGAWLFQKVCFVLKDIFDISLYGGLYLFKCSEVWLELKLDFVNGESQLLSVIGSLLALYKSIYDVAINVSSLTV